MDDANSRLIDMEGLEDLESVVIDAMQAGIVASDRNIHPDVNGPSHPIAKPTNLTLSGGNSNWIRRLKAKIRALRKKDPEIYPLF